MFVAVKIPINLLVGIFAVNSYSTISKNKKTKNKIDLSFFIEIVYTSGYNNRLEL